MWVKKTEIPFSATPVDQTLELTVNRDAASRLSEIVSMTNQASAHARWTITRSIRSQVVTGLKEMSGINRKEDVSKELRKSRVVRDNEDLQSLGQVIAESSNPFSNQLKNQTLFNIGTGKAQVKQQRKYLLSVMKTGNNLRTQFIKECEYDNDRFNRPIKRQVMHNFEKEGKKVTCKKGNKVQELELTSGLFGRLCCIAMEKKIDIDKLLMYSLTPVPLSLAHVDGSIAKTDKSALLCHLEKLYPSNSDPVKVV